MEYINISSRKNLKGKINSSSGSFDDQHRAERILAEEGFWRTRRAEILPNEFAIIDYGDEAYINFIELKPSQNGSASFPGGMKFEVSNDLSEWRVIHSERGIGSASLPFRLDIPLTMFRYLKIVIFEINGVGDKKYAEIGACIAGISGIKSVKGDSLYSEKNSPENLFEEGTSLFWETEPTAAAGRAGFTADLGEVYHLNKIRIASSISGFPEWFSVEVSDDNNIWIPVVEEKKFTAEPLKKYFWNIETVAAKFIRFQAETAGSSQNKFFIRLNSIEIFCAGFDYSHIHNTGTMTPPASIFKAGITKLSRDGECEGATVVQANDSRLRDATTLFKGIVTLAEDEDSSPGSVVQSSDSRLKPASEFKAGIVRLAYDRENNPGAAVQSSDSRLQHADDAKFGIVKLCPEGVYAEKAVVTGNDPRIKRATAANYGICRLAPDGASEEGAVVQSNDKRLKEAGVGIKGIMGFADNGEAKGEAAVQGNDRRLKDATVHSKGIVELAEDGEEKAGVAVQGNDRRLKDATVHSKGIVELAEDGEDKIGVAVQGNDRRLKDAAISEKGIMRFAADGEDTAGAAVQGNDRRLKTATVDTKGIVELAEDGEEKAGVAVQGDDRRLKEATVFSKGIVELAEDGEDCAGVAVQGNDRRLKEATVHSKGIVELAEDGEDKAGAAVQGNDRRLKESSIDSKGIVELAEDGEDSAGVAVQGNDRRLKEATIRSKGIVRLAENGEDRADAAVQGNDRRLKDATVHSKGIVELAEDGEDKPDTAIQGSDTRLKPASENREGIVRFAKSGEIKKGFAVQADDSRLSDARESLYHEHDYAPVHHDFNSHQGTITVSGVMNEDFSEITPPPAGSSVVHSENRSTESGSVGITGISGTLSSAGARTYGVIGHSRHVGIRGQSAGNEGARGCGVLGISRFGAGGVFSSEHDYSLVADGFGNLKNYDDSVNLIGRGKALYANGNSIFKGKIEIHKSEDTENFPVNIVEYFEVDGDEFLSPGDILVASPKGKCILSKSASPFSINVIGVISGNPSVVINNTGTETKIYPVALAGKTLCRIDARNRPVNPGDMIVTSGTSGCGMSGRIDSFDKIGSVIGKALDSMTEGMGLIPIFITHR